MIRNPKQLLELIESHLASLTYGDEPNELYEPIRYIMGLGGKRLRPLLTLLSYQLFKDDPEEVVEEALAVEMFHNFSLVHDDIMDKAPLRRGQPTVHIKWNENIGILSGDVMLVNVYDLLLQNEPENAVEIVRTFNKAAREVCEGQQYDMNFEERDDVTEEEYIEMIRLKTAVLLGFGLELGALLAGEEENREHLREFGMNIGIGFQLKDDLLDAFADSGKFGKQVGGDIIARKKTILVIRAMENANATDLAELKRLYGPDPGMADSKRVERVKEIFVKYDIPGLVEEEMNEYFDEGFKHLKQVNSPLNRRSYLRQFAENLIDRQH